MQHARRRSSPPLLFAIFFILLLCIFPALALASAAGSQQAQATSPDDELICHTSDPNECYPRIFRPTDEFQTVHKDQELPKGLHVRMNMSTGKLEAKINVDGEIPAELEGVPQGGDQAVLVVEPESSSGEPQIPDGAPEYEPVGKIKEPQNEVGHFYEALKVVREGAAKHGDRIDGALESLEDISHDIYYGLKITEDTQALKGLLCLMAGQDGAGRDTKDAKPQDQQAAAVLAGALSNNPTALKEVTKAWKDLMGDTCPGGDGPLGRTLYSGLVPASDDASGAEAKQSAARAKAKVGAINGLIKSDSIRSDFLAKDGMTQLLRLLVPEGREWAAAQRKVGQLALDTFLDEDMGATLGQWPGVARLGDDECRSAGAATGEGCWDYHVERIMKANRADKEHWSRDLHDRLAATRKGTRGGVSHDEL